MTLVPIGDGGEPLSDARVVVDGVPSGQGTTTVEMTRESHTVQVDAGPEYVPESFRISENTPDSVRVALRADELFRATVSDTNQVVNRWVTLNIGEAATEKDAWWSTAVNAIASLDFEMEMMDPKSGFLRTAWKKSGIGGKTLRRRFIGNKVSTDPLRWRLKYEAQIEKGSRWEPYSRGFKRDLDAIAEIRARTSS